MFKYCNFKLVILILIITYIFISLLNIYGWNELFTNEENLIVQYDEDKEEHFLMKYIDFNNTFYLDNKKIKFLYNSYNSFEDNK